MTTQKTNNKPVAVLVGQDGNVFNLIGIAARVLRQAGQKDEAAEMTKKVFACGSYHEALSIISEYVEIE